MTVVEEISRDSREVAAMERKYNRRLGKLIGLLEVKEEFAEEQKEKTKQIPTNPKVAAGLARANAIKENLATNLKKIDFLGVFTDFEAVRRLKSIASETCMEIIQTTKTIDPDLVTEAGVGKGDAEQLVADAKDLKEDAVELLGEIEGLNVDVIESFDIFGDIWNQIKDAVMSLFSWINDLKKYIDKVIDFFGQLSFIQDAIGVLISIVHWFIDFFKDPYHFLFFSQPTIYYENRVIFFNGVDYSGGSSSFSVPISGPTTKWDHDNGKYGFGKILYDVFASIVPFDAVIDFFAHPQKFIWDADGTVKLGGMVDGVINDVVETFTNPLDLIFGFFKEIPAAVKNVVMTIVNTFTDIFNDAIGFIKGIPARIMAVVNIIVSTFKNLFDTIIGIFTTMIAWISTIFSTIAGIFAKGIGFVKMVWTKIVDFYRMALSKIWSILQSIAPWITNLFKDVMGMFAALIEMGKFIFTLSQDLLTNPFEAIFKILMLIMGIIVGVTLLLLYILLSFGPSILIGFCFAWASSIIIAILETVVYAALMLLATVVFIVIWIANFVFNNSFTFLLRCENSPRAWYTAAGFAQGNLFKRFLLCFSPCAAGWNRIGGSFCSKAKASVPAFCPQQQVYGLFDGDRNAKVAPALPYIFDKHVPDTAFYGSSAFEKKTAILETLATKKAFLGTCATNMKPFDFMNKHVCGGVDRFIATQGPLKTEDLIKVQKIKALCKQSYCDYTVNKAANGAPIATTENATSDYKWCAGLGQVVPVSVTAEGDAAKEFLVSLLLLIIGTVGAFVLITLKGYAGTRAMPEVTS